MPQLLFTEMQSAYSNSFSAMYMLPIINVNEEQYEMYFCNQSSYTMEIKALKP